MAPKATRGTKRGSVGTAGAPAEKILKVDTEVAGVIEALGLIDISDDCRAMLVNFAAAALGTPATERHEVQALAVKMIGDVIAAHRTKLQESLANEQAKLTDIEASRESRVKQVKDGEEVVAELTARAEAKKKALAVASQTVIDKKNQVKEAEEAQRLGDAGLVEAAEYKKSLEAAFADNFQPLKSGECGPESKDHVDVLLPLVKRIPIDESLLTAMPSSLPKIPSERGMFDQMVVEQLEELIVGKIEELSQQLAATETARLERSKALEAAQASHDQAIEGQKEAANELRLASAAQRDASINFEEAKASFASFAPEYQTATRIRDEKKLACETFVTWNCACFELLRDKPSAEELAVAKAARDAARLIKSEAAAAATAVPADEVVKEAETIVSGNEVVEGVEA